MEYLAEDYKRLFHIVFKRRGKGDFHFWHLFCRKGFDHIYLLTAVNETSTLVISPTPTSCELDIYNVPLWECVRQAEQEESTQAVIGYLSTSPKLKKWRPRSVISCVSMAKYILGIGGFSLTPYGLFKYLGGKDG